MIDSVKGEVIHQKDFAERLLAQYGNRGVSLVGRGGLLKPVDEEGAGDPAGSGADREPR